MVKHMSINDLPVGRSVDETLRLVKAFQFVEKHGEGNVNELSKLLIGSLASFVNISSDKRGKIIITLKLTRQCLFSAQILITIDFLVHKKANEFHLLHISVCPAGWQPDSPTIKPDPKNSKEYFNKVN